MLDNRPIAHTNLSVSRVCLGAMTFGGQADEAASASMLDCWLDHGLNFVDTANVYNVGKSEEILGRIIGQRRDRIVLASKVGNPMGPDEKGLSKKAIFKAIDDTLRRLQTDHVDIYYFHQPDYTVPLEESLAAAGELVKQGKVGVLAASNYAGWQLCKMLWLAEKGGWPAVRVVQPMYNLLARGIEQELLPMCKEFQLATVAYNPLAGGLLTGKHRADVNLPGTRFDNNRAYRDRYWHDANFQAVSRLTEVAGSVGTTLIGLSLRWLLHHTAIDSIILGASRLAQLQENLKAIEQGPLPAEAVSTCDDVWKNLRGVTPVYNR
jgi:aryl-alcohol dehydrogenase-like predicted oxidoreductase